MLTNDEFKRLDQSRLAMTRAAKPEDKSIQQLAMEYIETIQPQLERAVKVIEMLVAQRDKSLCWRVRRFFATQVTRVKRLVAAWRE